MGFRFLHIAEEKACILFTTPSLFFLAHVLLFSFIA